MAKTQPFIPAGNEACNSLRDFMYKLFEKELKNELVRQQQGVNVNFTYMQPSWERSRLPAHRKPCIWKHGWQQVTPGYVEERDSDGKLRYRSVLKVESQGTYYSLVIAPQDAYGIPIGVRRWVTDEDMLPKEQMDHLLKVFMTGTRRQTAEVTVQSGTKLMLYAGITQLDRDTPLGAVKVKEDVTTLNRWLTRELEISSDDPRLNKMAEHLAEWEARENPEPGGLKFLEGEGIVKAYEQAKGGSSCMVAARSKFTKLYAANPEQVKLCLLLSTDKKTAIGRCLVWHHAESKRYFGDRVYPAGHVKTEKMMERALSDWAAEQGEKVHFTRSTTLKTTDCPAFLLKTPKPYIAPYLDTFTNNMLVMDKDGAIFLLVCRDVAVRKEWIAKHATFDSKTYLAANGALYWMPDQGQTIGQACWEQMNFEAHKATYFFHSPKPDLPVPKPEPVPASEPQPVAGRLEAPPNLDPNPDDFQRFVREAGEFRYRARYDDDGMMRLERYHPAAPPAVRNVVDEMMVARLQNPNRDQ